MQWNFDPVRLIVSTIEHHSVRNPFSYKTAPSVAAAKISHCTKIRDTSKRTPYAGAFFLRQGWFNDHRIPAGLSRWRDSVPTYMSMVDTRPEDSKPINDETTSQDLKLKMGATPRGLGELH